MASNKVILTEDQEKLIIDFWNNTNPPPSIGGIIEKVFDKKDMDARTHEGIAIRKFLASRGKYKKIDVTKKEEIELTQEQKEYIENNISSMTTNEIARILFNNPKLTPLSKETRTIIAFAKNINPNIKYRDEKELEDFKPPKNIDKLIPLINSIVINAYDLNKQDGYTKKCLEACIGYLNNRRFLSDIKVYLDEAEREMYISNYIRHIFDKHDLNQQDLDVICLFSQEVINHKQLKEHLLALKNLQKENIDGDAKMSMTLVEAISQAHKDLDKSVMRQSSLLSEINEKRSARIKKITESVSSLVNLVQVWREEESRNKFIGFAQEREELVRQEVKNLSLMDQAKALIFGMSEEELVNG